MSEHSPSGPAASAVNSFLTSISNKDPGNCKIAIETTIAGEAVNIDIDTRESKGSWVKDMTGQKYLNMHEGFGSGAVGMNHPGFTREFKQWAGETVANKIAHADFRTDVSNACVRAIFEDLAAPCGYQRMYFTDGGTMANSEAVWACIYTRTHANELAGISVKANAVMALTGAFHGRGGTGASLTEGNPKIAGHPKLPNFEHVPRPEFTAESIAATMAQIDTYCKAHPHALAAFIVEDGIQCEAGDKQIPPEFYVGLRKLADTHGFYVIYDAVQTGFYATGQAFAYQTIGAPAPDIVTGSKKSNLGYVFVGPNLLTVPDNAFVKPGIIDSTWFGNSADYLKMAALLKIVKAENLAENAAKQGAKFLVGLQGLAQKFGDIIKEVRGKGLILALEVFTPEYRSQVMKVAFDHHLILLESRNPTVIRLRPNLAVSDEDISTAMEILKKVMAELRKVKLRSKL